ncbi:PH domain-like protein [Lepidopterella palustris CBS 459.81]|uniref:PH domain-like protein n=1 Tax=Lepidopterella palustris CBS 459.81 TaxID=1314670 RepID=A0A8E2E719_9PEZI|nr:PH domain-like protein [Lepidopterella palustris CBS 459.81]
MHGFLNSAITTSSSQNFNAMATTSSRKSKSRTNNQPLPQPSDYETDVPPLDSLPPPPTRSNNELNLSVLRRHNPAILSILSIAPYAVLYLFSPSLQTWEKCGIEGTLFVVQLTPSHLGADRYAVMVLNRRGLENFVTELERGDDVENTEEYVILQVKGKGGDGDGPLIYGLWIFSEPASSTSMAREVNAKVIQDCAVQAEMSRKLLEAELRESSNGAGRAVGVEETQTEGEEGGEESAVPMGRQVSLRELFGKQRERDAGWSVHDHHSPAGQKQQLQQTQFRETPDTEFFRSAARFEPGGGGGIRMAQGPGEGGVGVGDGDGDGDGDVLGQLFRKAKMGYNGSG